MSRVKKFRNKDFSRMITKKIITSNPPEQQFYILDDSSSESDDFIQQLDTKMLEIPIRSVIKKKNRHQLLRINKTYDKNPFSDSKICLEDISEFEAGSLSLSQKIIDLNSNPSSLPNPNLFRGKKDYETACLQSKILKMKSTRINNGQHSNLDNTDTTQQNLHQVNGSQGYKSRCFGPKLGLSTKGASIVPIYIIDLSKDGFNACNDRDHSVRKRDGIKKMRVNKHKRGRGGETQEDSSSSTRDVPMRNEHYKASHFSTKHSKLKTKAVHFDDTVRIFRYLNRQ